MNNRLNPGAYRAPEPQAQKDLKFRALGTVEASGPTVTPWNADFSEPEAVNQEVP